MLSNTLNILGLMDAGEVDGISVPFFPELDSLGPRLIGKDIENSVVTLYFYISFILQFLHYLLVFHDSNF